MTLTFGTSGRAASVMIGITTPPSTLLHSLRVLTAARLRRVADET
ncbi:hypothetical protein GFS60_01321 [Rhodococcus sp. WAY2]|nr:hypothetical protein GFS60_01321 [Rhodococcus sp. WAY2]